MMKNLMRALLALCAALPASLWAATPVAVPTFESVGLYWQAPAPVVAGDDDAQLQYRVVGATTWSDALPIWYDRRNGEYRGSVVNLKPGTAYNFRIVLDNGTSTIVSTTTWKQTFPVAKTITLPQNSNQTLYITQSGTPTGYVVYTGAPGVVTTINVNKSADYNIKVNAKYVIIRGLVLRGAKKHGILLGDGNSGKTAGVSDVVIEGNDISGWGSPSTADPRFGRDVDSAIFTNSLDTTRIVIQRNKLHHPSYDTNSWEEKNGSTYHPLGPQAITIRNSPGNLVIRYNDIYSDSAHYFQDGMGGTGNFSDAGFPNRDSDIYGNHISQCWDDAIEAEGGNRNVRIWGNYMDRIYVPFGVAATSRGPMYAWRNVINATQYGPSNTTFGNAFKMRNVYGGVDWGGGRIYIFNNSGLKPPGGETPMTAFLKEFDQPNRMRQLRSLNNIMMVRGSAYFSIKDSYGTDNKFDYDLIGGKTAYSKPQQAHGVVGQAKHVAGWGYDSMARTGSFSLDATSPGYDVGTLIPNFVTTYTGRGVDMGAHEAFTPRMQFGVNAYK